MTTQPDPADGTLVEREGVNAASDRSTAEGDGPLPSAESTLTGFLSWLESAPPVSR